MYICVKLFPGDLNPSLYPTSQSTSTYIYGVIITPSIKDIFCVIG